MLAIVAALVAFLLVVEPLLVAIHEAGHAAVPLALGHDTAIFLGGEGGRAITIGRLTIAIAPAGFLRPITDGATLSDVETGRWTLLGGTLGGPAASLILALVTWLLLQLHLPGLLWWLVFMAFVYSALQLSFTLVPIRSATVREDAEPFRTDGRIALELLLGRDPILDAESETAIEEAD